jgi:hypothetical protein
VCQDGIGGRPDGLLDRVGHPFVPMLGRPDSCDRPGTGRWAGRPLIPR